MMKKMFFLTIAILGVLLVNAQDGHVKGERKTHTPEEKADRQVKMLTKQLSLTADQQASVKNICLNTAKKVGEIKASSVSKEEKKVQVMTAKKEKDEQITVLLTEDQKVKYTELKEKRKEKMKEHRKNKADKNTKDK